MENVRKHKDIKLVTTERRSNCLVSKPNYHTTKFFTDCLLATEMKKKKKQQILLNKPVYLGHLILDLSKTLTYKFWYDNVKQKYFLCYMDTDSFNVYIKTDDIYRGIVEDVKIGFNTSNYELNRSLPKGKNKIVI